jgi:hypothetical protein
MVGKRRVKHRSIRTVQQFNGNFELGSSCRRVKPLPDPLPQAAMDILRILGAGLTAGNAMAAAGVVKSDVSYWAKRFVANGVLIVDEAQYSKTLGKPRKDQRFGPGYPKYYKLTDFGSKLLTTGEAAGRLPVVFEDFPVKFSVLRWEPFGVIDWVKLGDVRNWQKMGFRVTGVRVVKTSKSVIVHPGPLAGFDVDELEVESGRIVERVRYILEVQYKMQFDESKVEFLHGPMWQVFHPDAKAWVKEGGKVRVPGYGNLDESEKPWLKKLSGVPHVEFENKRHAAIAAAWPVATDIQKRNASAAPLYPLYLEEIHRMVSFLVPRVEALEVNVEAIKGDQAQVSGVMAELKRLADSLSRLDNLERLPEISESLRKVAGVLNMLVDVEGSQGKGEQQSEVSKGSGGSEYVS